MEEFKETFTNPFNIKCDGCGAPAEYDIIHRNYHCQHCGATTDLHAPVRALERYRKLHAQELKASTQKDKCQKYNCPNCGAVVVLDTTEATANCDFCGTKMVNSEFVNNDAFPELIIPFKITLEEAKVELKKWLKDNNARKEAKKLEPRVDELKGYYLPYQVVKGPVKCSVSRNRNFRKYECGGFLEEVAVNTSNQLDNLLLDAMEPFDWREIAPFEYGYIAGQHTKLQDANEIAIQRRIEEEVTEAYTLTLEKNLQSADLSTHVDTSEIMTIPALMPVYIITRGQVQVAINGQTGRVSVTPLKETTVQRNWLEPVLTLLFVTGLCEIVPLFFHYHPSFELSGMLSLVVALIVWAAYGSADTIKKIIYLQSEKQLAKRGIDNKLTFTDGKELIDNPALTPVFFEMIDGTLEPAKIAFYTTERIIKGLVIALVLAFLPNVLAYLVVGYDVVLHNYPISDFDKIHHLYAAAWWTLMIPILFILWIAVVRRDVFDYPVIYHIMPNGTTVRYDNPEDKGLSFKGILSLCMTSPFCWIVLFILFMIFGSVGAMIS